MALVFLINLIGAPSGIGWVAAMILAFGPRRLPRGPAWPRNGAQAAVWREWCWQAAGSRAAVWSLR
jgi:hypothetical protein